MNRRRLLILALLLAAGCADPSKLLPDRAGVNFSVDAESRKLDKVGGSLFWNLR